MFGVTRFDVVRRFRAGHLDVAVRGGADVGRVAGHGQQFRTRVRITVKERGGMRIIRTGITRTVILIGRYAVKVPSFRGHVHGDMRGRIAGFCHGIIANQTEFLWHDFEGWSGKVAPVLHSWLWGVVQIYPRCEPAPDDAVLFELDPCPGDLKADNFGLLDGHLVRVDYVI